MLYTFPNFLMYFSTSLMLITLALTIYKWVTPYNELELIRSGNSAAAVSYLGTCLGMVIAMGSVIVHSAGILDMVVWSLISLATQLGAWFVINRVMGNLQKGIAQDACMSHGAMLGGGSLALGMLQAACLVY